MGRDVLLFPRQAGAEQAAARPDLLRRGGELRRAAVLQYLFAQRNPDRHREPGFCPAAAEAVPKGLRPPVRPAAGGRAGQADFLHGGPEKDPPDLRYLRPGGRHHRGPPGQFGHSRRGVLPGVVSPGGLYGRGLGDGPGEALSFGAGHVPSAGEPGGPAADGGGGLRPENRQPGRELRALFQAERPD